MSQTLLIFSLFISSLAAGSYEARAADHEAYAFKVYKRIVGVPPTSEDLAKMTDLLKKNKKDDAINIALEADEFYDVRLVPWIKYWFNEDDTNRVPLNDSVATVVGAIRDNVPFNQILSSDILYVGSNEGLANNNQLPNASLANNNHYEQIEDRQLPLKSRLVRTTQSEYYDIDPEKQEIAGVYTTRGFASAYYVAGTNRAAFQATMNHFFCADMESLHDNTIPNFRIRQDVTREPAGNPETFLSTCMGCHAGMDALSGAWAYFDFVDEALVYNKDSLAAGSTTANKYHNNDDTFPEGYRTKDNGWINLWNSGQNASLGWKGEQEGQGVKELGELISGASQFSSCMSEQVFELVCLHKPKTAEEMEAVRNISYRFRANSSYDMKQIFRDTAKFCVAL
ncbi:hypothetical protein N9D31_02850 [Oligoflexaceae bacterium]|nr:hypothetical protein [Oligoflexaceae bacterium]